MTKHFATRLLLPISIALAVTSCQQPSATNPTSSPSVAASASPTTTSTTTTTTTATTTAAPSESPSPEASASPSDKPEETASSSKTKDVDAFIQQNAQYKEMYEATGGIKYVGLVETETCKALDSGVDMATLTSALEKEFDKQGDTLSPEKLTQLKEYTGFLVGASVALACPQHVDKIK